MLELHLERMQQIALFVNSASCCVVGPLHHSLLSLKKVHITLSVCVQVVVMIKYLQFQFIIEKFTQSQIYILCISVGFMEHFSA